MEAEIVGVFATCRQSRLPTSSNTIIPRTKQLDRTKVLKTLKPILENCKDCQSWAKIKYDYHILKNYDIELQGLTLIPC